MESFWSRYKNVLVLLIILMTLIAGLIAQKDRKLIWDATVNEYRWRPTIKDWVPHLERILDSSVLGDLARKYSELRRLRQRNLDLQEAIRQSRLRLGELREDARQRKRLEALWTFKNGYIDKETLGANVVDSPFLGSWRGFFIDRGLSDGLQPDMAVITPDGIVGKVSRVFPHSAQILLVNDRNSGTAVVTEKSKIHGILRGGNFGQLEIVGVLADQNIQPGERVSTTGADSVFVPGLPVGVIEKVTPEPGNDSLRDVVLEPAVRFEAIDEVLVILNMALIEEASKIETQNTAINDQRKALDLMAEELPGLILPNLSPRSQPLYDNSYSILVKRPPQPLHSDRFTPPASTNEAEIGHLHKTGKNTLAP